MQRLLMQTEITRGFKRE